MFKKFKYNPEIANIGDRMYDVAILGGGPAGVSAAVYCSRYRLKCVLFAEELGGQVTKTHKIENFLGIESISGMELTEKFRKQLEFNKIDFQNIQVQKVVKKDNSFLINDQIQAKSLIICLGMKRRKLNIPGENEFLGRGVSYCATCDAAFFKEKIVGVVGGNDSAAVAADILSQHAKKVYIIYRKDKIRAEPAWIEEIEKNSKIEIINNTKVTEIKGSQTVESVKFDNGDDLNLNGVFIEIGAVPSTILLNELGVELNENGFIKIEGSQKTNVDGVFAAGDITTGCNKLHQIITAAAEGAIAAESIYIWLKQQK